MARMTPRLRRRVQADFPEPGSAEEVARLVSAASTSERVQAAIVLSANGDLRCLRDSIALARTDWRDVLVRGELAHENWTERLDARLGPQDWPAVGVTLTLLTSPDGGRTKPMGGAGPGDAGLPDQPTWGLPDTQNTAPIGASVVCVGRVPVETGDTTRAVIVPCAPGTLDRWWRIEPGDELRMFEGARICGRATAEWIEKTAYPVSELEERQFLAWARGHADASRRGEAR